MVLALKMYPAISCRAAQAIEMPYLSCGIAKLMTYHARFDLCSPHRRASFLTAVEVVELKIMATFLILCFTFDNGDDGFKLV